MTQTLIIPSPDANGNLPVTVSNFPASVTAVVQNFPAAPLAKPNVAADNWVTNQVVIPANQATPIIPARTGPQGTGRVSATIQNLTGAAQIALGPNSSVSLTNGQMLQQVSGDSLTIETTGPVYGFSSVAQTVSYHEVF